MGRGGKRDKNGGSTGEDELSDAAVMFESISDRCETVDIQPTRYGRGGGREGKRRRGLGNHG